MIVDTGKLKLLVAQAAAFAGWKWRLFQSNTTITSATVLTDLTTAAFTGYADVTIGTMSTPVLQSGRAIFYPTTQPVWTNTGGTTATVYGWACVDTVNGVLISAFNTGSLSIPAGQSLTLNPAVTDTDG